VRDRRKDLAHLGMVLCGLVAMLQASGFDCVAFDPFSFQQDCLAAPEVDVGWGAQDPAASITAKRRRTDFHASHHSGVVPASN
jgi:hypothetical protein